MLWLSTNFFLTAFYFFKTNYYGVSNDLSDSIRIILNTMHLAMDTITEEELNLIKKTKYWNNLKRYKQQLVKNISW